MAPHPLSESPPSAARWDVIVCGAGPAGLCAAVAAGRAGARTLVIERYGFAGGMSTAALVYPWMTFHDRTGEQVVLGLAEEIVRRLVARGASPGHLGDTIGFVHSVTPFDPAAFRVLADEMLAEARCDVLYHGLITGARREGDRIAEVRVASPSGSRRLAATVFADCTGDATLCHQAGAEMQSDITGRAVQPMTMCFRLGGVDIAAIARYIVETPTEFHETTLVGHEPLTGVSGFFSLWREAELPIPRDRLLFFVGTRPGEVYINTSRIQGRDGTDPADLAEAEREGRGQVAILHAFLRRSVPGFSDAYIAELPTQVGVRETRRIVGDYTMTSDDVTDGARFEDGVARGAFPIDIHSPSGSGILFSGPPARPYDVPYRSLIPKELSNVIVAGRCISATHESHASTRLTPTCMATGEAAGRAAAWAGTHGRDVREWTVEREEDRGCAR